MRLSKFLISLFYRSLILPTREFLLMIYSIQAEGGSLPYDQAAPERVGGEEDP
jgi:hypothetical protein